jgi:Ca2+:H+ antiporter
MLTSSDLDLFEIAILVASCFIVNYVTADAKTNWAEGASMVSFYFMIVSRAYTRRASNGMLTTVKVICAWYYPGSRESEIMSACDSVASSLQKLAEHHAAPAASR